jgi:hypothetical protein
MGYVATYRYGLAALIMFLLVGCDIQRPTEPDPGLLFSFGDPCDPQIPEGFGSTCEPPTDPFPDSAGLFAGGWNPSWCMSTSWDLDADGMHDACEMALAAAFAPTFRYAQSCSWDHSMGRMGGEYFFAVEWWVAGISAIITYLPAYYWDCGVPNRDGLLAACHLFRSTCGPHTGDTEFVTVLVVWNSDTQHWLTHSVFLSAHCGAPWPAYLKCKWYDWPSFQWVDGHSRGAPIIWVAEGKNANYKSKASFDDGGAFGFDTCEFSNTLQPFPVQYHQQNVGSRHLPRVDCGPPLSVWPSTARDTSLTECIWSSSPKYRGWQPPATWLGDAPTNYGDLLATYIGI